MNPLVAELLRDPIAAYPAATVACFDPTIGDLPRRKLDHELTISFLERLAGAGAPAVLIAASTGGGHLRTPEELAEWFRVAAEAHLGSCVRMALLRPEDGDEVNAQLIDLLAELDYPIVFVRPGTNLAPNATDAQIAANMQPLVERAATRGLAVGLYSIPDVSGMPMPPAAVVRLLNGPGGDHIVAIKVTEADYENSTRKFLEMPELSRLKIVQGWDPHLATALQDGPRFNAAGRQRCGVTSGPMSFAVYQYLHMLAAADRGEWEELAAAQSAVTALFQAMQDDPLKFADLQRAKFLMGLGHPLLGTVTEEQTAKVLAALAALPRDADRDWLTRSLNLMHA